MTHEQPTQQQRKKLKEEWAKRNGLKESSSNRSTLDFLTNKFAHYRHNPLPGDDHVNLWIKNGKPYCVTSQPYGFSRDSLHEAADVCKKHNLVLLICTYPAWHYPGSVLFLEWRIKS